MYKTILVNLLAITISSAGIAFAAEPTSCPSPSYEVCFTPGQNCEQSIIDAIAKANESIYIQAYDFTSNYIAKALVAAAKKNVKVSMILDHAVVSDIKTNSAIKALEKVNIPLAIDNLSGDKGTGLSHNKVIIIDNKTVITGSYNFTIAAARYNAENVLIVTSPDIAQKYMDNWNVRYKASKPYSYP